MELDHAFILVVIVEVVFRVASFSGDVCMIFEGRLHELRSLERLHGSTAASLETSGLLELAGWPLLWLGWVYCAYLLHKKCLEGLGLVIFSGYHCLVNFLFLRLIGIFMDFCQKLLKYFVADFL